MYSTTHSNLTLFTYITFIYKHLSTYNLVNIYTYVYYLPLDDSLYTSRKSSATQY